MTENIEITIPETYFQQLISNSATLEKILDLLAYETFGTRPKIEMEWLEASIITTRKIQEWSIQYHALSSDYKKLKASIKGE